MNSKIKKTNLKRVFLKSYLDFTDIEKVLNSIQKKEKLQVAIIGKFANKNFNVVKDIIIEQEKTQKRCEKIFNIHNEFEIISNPKIGNIFIAGFLVSMFSQVVEQKKIGSMPTGPLGILRGLSIDKEKVNDYLESLNNGNYLLILRANENELITIEDYLNKSSKLNIYSKA